MMAVPTRSCATAVNEQLQRTQQKSTAVYQYKFVCKERQQARFAPWAMVCEPWLRRDAEGLEEEQTDLRRSAAEGRIPAFASFLYLSTHTHMPSPLHLLTSQILTLWPLTARLSQALSPSTLSHAASRSPWPLHRNRASYPVETLTLGSSHTLVFVLPFCNISTREHFFPFDLSLTLDIRV